jgi:hypothetical protein
MCSRALIGANGKIMPPRRIATAQSFSERKILRSREAAPWNRFPSRAEKENVAEGPVHREQARELRQLVRD